MTGKPLHKANLEIYLQPTVGFFKVVKVSCPGSSYSDRANSKKIAGHTLPGLRSEYSFDDYSLFLEIDPLLDKTYYYTDGLLAPPRVWIIGLNWKI